MSILVANAYNYINVKVSPLQAMKAHGGCKDPLIHSHGTRKKTHFLGGSVDLRSSLDMKE